MDDTVVLTDHDKAMGTSIAKSCAITDEVGNISASKMMWPVIHKGLTYPSVYS